MFLTLAAAFSLSVPRFCSIESPPGPAPAPNVVAAALVKEAALIVRARALGPDTSASKDAHQLVFEVEEVLKTPTTVPPSRLSIRGYLSDQDDFNRQPVPYDYVRPSGLRGSCYAESYRAGADYLLMLDESQPGVFTPYWWALRPTNEQLHGSDDPWFVWVRARVAAEPGAGRPPKN